MTAATETVRATDPALLIAMARLVRVHKLPMNGVSLGVYESTINVGSLGDVQAWADVLGGDVETYDRLPSAMHYDLHSTIRGRRVRVAAIDVTVAYSQAYGEALKDIETRVAADSLPRRTPGAALAADPAPAEPDMEDERPTVQQVRAYFRGRWVRLTIDQRQRLALRCRNTGNDPRAWDTIYREIVAETRTDLPIYQQRTAGSLR